ncbi:MAG TPA: response regulator [Ktedonobacterales bacterium]|nr:response regulator [Ktedonobacterales bacterium]
MAQTRVRAATPTICVIEDDEGIREALRALLEDSGYHVIEAANGLEGYRLLRESAGRLVALVDHKMPQMDGCDLLELVAKDEDLRTRHEFIFVTASPRHAEEDCGETMEELSATLLPKPFHIDEVLDAVSEAAGRMASE